MAPIIPILSAVGSAIGAGVSAVGGIGTVLGIAGAGLTAVSALSAGRQDASNADVQAQISAIRGNEAQIAADESARQARINARRVLGAQRAGLAAAGVALDSESALAIVGDTMNEGEYQATMLSRAGAVEKALYQAQSDIYRSNAKEAKKASVFKAGATLLSGGASAFSRARSISSPSTSYSSGRTYGDLFGGADYT